MQVNEAYNHCKEVIEYHSKTFAKAFQHLPKKKRQAVWAVYAFCRQADDIVDEGFDRERELQLFKYHLDEFANDRQIEPSFLWIALKDAFTHFDFDLEPFYEMISGQEMDLKKTRYESVEEMIHYSYHVASTVGLMLLPILSPKNQEELKESAIALGYAMQITNILRDIGEDLERDRIYLPKQLMDKYNYTIPMLENGVVNDSFVDLWEDLAQRAEDYYDIGLSKMYLYPVNARIPVKAAAHFYKGILNSVRANRYDVFEKRAFVSNEEKKEILSAIEK
ncbi:phytoene synthase [Salipaludibacillus keqinensis]|uniref:Phytoene synthase n=1 Tax=Salipaludibacillus keqinensis TaxID=2045207 RepID=A0A323TKD2_9BACI|nr:phytoene/squalene synthase family protein [Salipaludibacillus keqinensis]PYZ94414.1 phytoene synthase [Salipaludibacillus keqinensis]